MALGLCSRTLVSSTKCFTSTFASRSATNRWLNWGSDGTSDATSAEEGSESRRVAAEDKVGEASVWAAAADGLPWKPFPLPAGPGSLSEEPNDLPLGGRGVPSMNFIQLSPFSALARAGRQAGETNADPTASIARHAVEFAGR